MKKVYLSAIEVIVKFYNKIFNPYYPITKNVSVNRRGEIYISPEEMQEATARVAEIKKIEKERLEFLSKTKYSKTTIDTKCGKFLTYYHYTKKIPESVYLEGIGEQNPEP